jgi:hypothetical protein
MVPLQDLLNRKVIDSNLVFMDFIFITFLFPFGIISNVALILIYQYSKRFQKSQTSPIIRLMSLTQIFSLSVAFTYFLKDADTISPLAARSNLTCKLSSYIYDLTNAAYAWLLVILNYMILLIFKNGIDFNSNASITYANLFLIVKFKNNKNSTSSLTLSTTTNNFIQSNQTEATGTRIRLSHFIKRNKKLLPESKIVFIFIIMFLSILFTLDFYTIERDEFKYEYQSSNKTYFKCIFKAKNLDELEFLIKLKYGLDFLLKYLLPILLLIISLQSIIKRAIEKLGLYNRLKLTRSDEKKKKIKYFILRYIFVQILFSIFSLPTYVFQFCLFNCSTNCQNIELWLSIFKFLNYIHYTIFFPIVLLYDRIFREKCFEIFFKCKF